MERPPRSMHSSDLTRRIALICIKRRHETSALRRAHLLRAVDAINSPRSVTSASRELSLGCSGRNFKNELYAKADSRKPKAAFLDLVGSAAAIIFTQPKDNTLAGVTRCINKTEASIAISRHPNE